MYATQLAGVPSYRRDLGEPWTVSRVFWITMSKRRMLAGIQALRDAGDNETFQGFDPDGPMSVMLSDDEDIAVEIDGRRGWHRRSPLCGRMPLRSHRTVRSSLAQRC
jgi:N-acetyl-1-D-myo-inositol-2-amino-2-deoxy-alpha-D-glucopyranoside deacetylase